MGVIGRSVKGCFGGVLGRSGFLLWVDNLGRAAIVLLCPPSDLCGCFDAWFGALNTGRVTGFAGVDPCDSCRVGESLIFFLLSLSPAETGSTLLVPVTIVFVTGVLLNIGLGIRAASSSSLEGTSNTLAPRGGADEGIFVPSPLVLFSDFSLSGGVLLGDLDSECWLSLGSGASESGAGDEKP